MIEKSNINEFLKDHDNLFVYASALGFAYLNSFHKIKPKKPSHRNVAGAKAATKLTDWVIENIN